MLKLGGEYALADKASLYSQSITSIIANTPAGLALRAHLFRVVEKVEAHGSDAIVLAQLHHALSLREAEEVRNVFPMWVYDGLQALHRGENDDNPLDVILRVKPHSLLRVVMAADLEDQIDQKVNVSQASLELYALLANCR